MRFLGRVIGKHLRSQQEEAAIDASTTTAIPFSCPYCEQETLVPLEYAGQSGPCATCGKKITVPFVAPGHPLGPHEFVTGIPYGSGTKARTIVMITISAIVAAATVVATVVMLLFPAIGAARSAAQSRHCDSNLARIGEALQAYEAECGSMPPAYIVGKDGKRMHSWRVLILPYLDEVGLYQEYDFSQPWDSQHNQRLATRMPDVFACPADPDATQLDETNYMVIVGNNTLFPYDIPVATMYIGDDLSTTIAVVEVPAWGVNWLEPMDLSTEQMFFDINGNIGREIGSYHHGGAHVLMADGQVRYLDEGIPADYVKGMSTIDGGETISWDLLD